LRDVARARDTELIVRLNPALNVSNNKLIEASKIMNLEFNNYEEYLEKYSEPSSDKALITIAWYNDGLGYLLHKRLIDIDIIEYQLCGSSTTLWEKVKPIIEGMRKQYDQPEIYQWFEYLYEEMKK
jgi:hypothetical protein